MDGVEISILHPHSGYVRSLTRTFVVAVLWVLATTSVAAAQDVPPLPRVTTISGNHSGYTEVELTKPLRPFDEDEPEITFQGGGEMIGVVLRSPTNGLGTELEFHAYSPGGIGEFRGGNYEDEGTFPPGRYRLYLIADQPGSATIEFTNLEPGQLSVEPTVETPQRSGPMSTRTSGGVVKFSERVTLWGGGVIFMTVYPTPAIGTELELCYYWPAQEDQAGDRAYDPGCPYGHSGYKTSVMSEGEGAFSFTAPSYSWAEGVGGNVTNLVGTPGPVDTYLFTAGYDLAPPAGSTTEPTPGTEDDPPVSGPLTTDSASEEPQSEPSDPTTERRCRDSGCADQWGTALLASRRARLRGRRARVVVTCSESDPCRGSVGFVRARAHRFDLPAGASARVRIVVPRELRQRVRRTGRARGRVAVASRLNDERVEVRRRVRIRGRP